MAAALTPEQVINGKIQEYAEYEHRVNLLFRYSNSDLYCTIIEDRHSYQRDPLERTGVIAKIRCCLVPYEYLVCEMKNTDMGQRRIVILSGGASYEIYRRYSDEKDSVCKSDRENPFNKLNKITNLFATSWDGMCSYLSKLNLSGEERLTFVRGEHPLCLDLSRGAVTLTAGPRVEEEFKQENNPEFTTPLQAFEEFFPRE